MFTKPDLLFQKDIEEIVEDELQLSYIEKAKRQRIFLNYDENATVQLNRELISNFSPTVQTFDPMDFPQDLGLDVLIRDFLQPKNSSKFQMYVLSHAPTEISPINYRWGVVDELLDKTSLMRQLNSVSEQLFTVFTRLNQYRRDMDNHEMFDKKSSQEKLKFLNVPLLLEYSECIKALAQITEGCKSGGLKSVFDYSVKIIESDQFKTLSEFLYSYINDQYVELEVTLNGINQVSKVDYLGVLENKIDRNLIKKIEARKSKKKVEENFVGRLFESYEGLLVRASNNLIEDSMKQIEQTTYLIGDIEFYNGLLRYRNILLENNLPATRPKFSPMSERKHNISKMYCPLINYHSNCCSGEVSYIAPIIPNDYDSDFNSNIRLVTGPNNGGKTRATTGFGLIYPLAQSAFFVHAEKAEISLVDNIFTHFVFGDHSDNESGRWVNEISRMDQMLYHMSPYSLSLIDDFGSGTNYQEARIPALNVIYGHHKLGATLLMNTHLHQLAKDVENGEFPAVSNWQVEAYVEDKKLVFTHQIVPGKAGQSYAQLIAESHGLSRSKIDEVIQKRVDAGELDLSLLR